MMKRRISLLLVLLLLVGHIQAPALSFPFNFGGNKEESVTITKEEYERLKKYEKLDEVRAFLDQYYYQEPDENALLDGAIQGLLAGTGDVYTFYYPEESWNTMWEEDEGKYAGIGIQMLGSYETNMVTITRVFKGTPAEAAGIRKGDILYKVEELEITVATLQDAVNVMRGTPGEKVHVELFREGEVLPFDVTKAEIIINRVESMMLEKNSGYIAH
ncbi:MAG: PDZ domain-containing protein [Clostridiales bacterium]|nr:PDZ domain-containing protein [Clostridiales bacterium]